MNRRRFLAVGLAAPLGGCGGRPRVTAGGATFVDPLVHRWAAEYRRLCGVEVDYVARGSGFGVEQVARHVFDFGCTDVPVGRAQGEAAGGDLVHVPLTVGAVAVVAHVPGVDRPLNLSGPVLADLFLKRVTRWDDPAVAALNPGVPLPGIGVVVAVRAEASGTSHLFGEYLAKVNPGFADAVGAGANPRWPAGAVGQHGNDGVAGFVRHTPGAVGYVEALHAGRCGLRPTAVRNKGGAFVAPTPDGAAAAAAAALGLPQTAEPYSLHRLTYSLTDADGADTYPVCGLSYAVLHARRPTDAGRRVVDFLRWAVADGQAFARPLGYAPLPKVLAEQALARLGEVDVG